MESITERLSDTPSPSSKPATPYSASRSSDKTPLSRIASPSAIGYSFETPCRPSSDHSVAGDENVNPDTPPLTGATPVKLPSTSAAGTPRRPALHPVSSNGSRTPQTPSLTADASDVPSPLSTSATFSATGTPRRPALHPLIPSLTAAAPEVPYPLSTPATSTAVGTPHRVALHPDFDNENVNPDTPPLTSAPPVSSTSASEISPAAIVTVGTIHRSASHTVFRDENVDLATRPIINAASVTLPSTSAAATRPSLQSVVGDENVNPDPRSRRRIVSRRRRLPTSHHRQPLADITPWFQSSTSTIIFRSDMVVTSLPSTGIKAKVADAPPAVPSYLKRRKRCVDSDPVGISCPAAKRSRVLMFR